MHQKVGNGRVVDFHKVQRVAAGASLEPPVFQQVERLLEGWQALFECWEFLFVAVLLRFGFRGWNNVGFVEVRV